MGQVADAVGAWKRAAPGEERRRLDDALYVAIHDAGERAARRFRQLPLGDVEDLVQEKAIKLWHLLKEDACEDGAEDAYVRTTIHSGCKDLLRKSRPVELEDTTPRPERVAPTYSEGMLQGARRHIHGLSGKPREAMVWVFIEERPQSELVDALLREEVESDSVDPFGDLEQARKRLSNRVDQWLSRGRKRVEYAYLAESSRVFDEAPEELARLLRGRYSEKLSDKALAEREGVTLAALRQRSERALLWLRARLLDNEREASHG